MHQTLNFGFGLLEIDGIIGQSGGWVGALSLLSRPQVHRASD
jgi:hypothetical protein